MKRKKKQLKLFNNFLIPIIVTGIILFFSLKPSKADYYIKDDSEILKPIIPKATLYLSYDDGILCFINGSLIVNVLEEYHPNKYWNRQLDVYKYLKKGLNLIACQVSNGDGNSGKSGGNFDAELVVSGEKIFSRGKASTCSTNTTWRYYGSGGSTLYPLRGVNGESWYQTNYSDSNWNFGIAPFGEGNWAKSCTKGILKKAPDDAWFRKWFNITNLQIYNNNFEQSLVPINNLPDYPKPILIRLGENPQVDMSRVYITKSQRPVITGLVKYNSKVRIYIDGKYDGDAKVKEGEKSGTSNFYYYTDLKPGRHTYFAAAQSNATAELSFPSKLITFDIK